MTHLSSVAVIRFGGPVVRGALAVSVVVLVGWCRLLLLEGPWALAFGAVALLAGWVVWVLLSFRLELTPTLVVRRLGPLRVACSWQDLHTALVQQVPGVGRIRLVLSCSGDHRISLPLFLLSVDSQRVLAERLLTSLPLPVRHQWISSGADSLLRRG